jgi:hypothetical protein
MFYIRISRGGLLNLDRKNRAKICLARISDQWGGKVLSVQPVFWHPTNSVDSCRNQAITTKDSGLAGLGSGVAALA